MQKSTIYILSLGFTMSLLTSCSSWTKLKQTVQSKTTQWKTAPKRNLPAMVAVPQADNDNIEFLDNISVKPGRVYLKKASDAIESEPILVSNQRSDRMPDNLTDVEKANWLQLKYSIQMVITKNR